MTQWVNILSRSHLERIALVIDVGDHAGCVYHDRVARVNIVASWDQLGAAVVNIT